MKLSLNRILVVDEDPDFQAVLRDALEHVAGYEVEVCTGGDQFVQKASDFAPDLILLDAQLPERDDNASLHALRSRADTAGTPVVFLSNGVSQKDVDRYRLLGVQDVIKKTDDPATLPLTVRNIWDWYNM